MTSEERRFREDGLLWLRASAAYECYNDTLIPDATWDELTILLRDNYSKLDVYLRWAIPYSCLESATASGIKWDKGLPFIAKEAAWHIISRRNGHERE